MQNFFQHEFLHFLIGLLVGLLSFRLFKDKRLILIALFVSFAIDLDHLVDYFHYFGLKIINPYTSGHFWDFFCDSGKLFIPLHAWEFLPILLLLGFKFQKIRVICLTITLALLGHYLLDQFSHNMYPLAYSLIFRLTQNFDINAVSWGCRLI